MASFDLSLAEAKTFVQAHSIIQFVTWALGGLLVAWLVVMVLVIPRLIVNLTSLIRTPWSGWWLLALVGAIVVQGLVVLYFLSLLLMETIAHGGRGPVQMEVGPTGFTLFWTKGSPYFQSWSNLRKALVVKDFSDAGYQARIQLSRYWWVALSGEAAKALAAEASKHRLTVSAETIVSWNGAKGVQTVISSVVRVTTLAKVNSSVP